MTGLLMGSRRGSGAAGRALCLATVITLCLAMSGCSRNPAPMVRFFQSAGDDVLRQSNVGDDLAKLIKGDLDDLSRTAPSVVDDSARAKAAMNVDAEAAEALAGVCEVAVDGMTGQLPQNANEWFDYARGIAGQRSGAESLVSDLEQLGELVDAWNRGEVEYVRVYIAATVFKHFYC